MATSNILGGKRAPQQPTGRDVDALGPSDSSDSGSDVQGTFELDDDAQYDTQAGAQQTGMAGDSGRDISPDSVQSLAPLTPDTDTLPLEGLETDLSDLASDEDDGSEADIEPATPRRGH